MRCVKYPGRSFQRCCIAHSLPLQYNTRQVENLMWIHIELCFMAFLCDAPFSDLVVVSTISLLDRVDGVRICVA